MTNAPDTICRTCSHAHQPADQCLPNVPCGQEICCAPPVLDQYAVKVIYTEPPGRGPHAGARVTRVYSRIIAADPATAADLAVKVFTADGKVDIEVLEVTRL